MNLVTRAKWGARSPKTTPSKNIKPTAGSVLHWEGAGVPEVLDHSLCDDEVRKIQNFHMNTRGWNDIAYSFLVCRHGYVYEGRGVGVRSAANHTNDANYNSYAVCYIGDGTPEITPKGANGMLDAVLYLRNKGAGKGIRPHSAIVATQCPGDKIRKLIDDEFFNSAVPAPNPVPTPVPTPVSQVTAKLQAAVHVGVDNKWGAGTDKALQTLRYAKKGTSTERKALQGVVGTSQDGVWGPKSQAAYIETVKEVQGVLGQTKDGDWGPKTDAAFVSARNKYYMKF